MDWQSADGRQSQWHNVSVYLAGAAALVAILVPMDITARLLWASISILFLHFFESEEGLPKKMAELKALGGNVTSPAVPQYAAAPEKLWDSLEECERDLQNATIHIGYVFGSEDPLMNDYYESNMYAWKITRGCHFTILNGEKHLLELDTPRRVADETLAFINQAHKDYE